MKTQKGIAQKLLFTLAVAGWMAVVAAAAQAAPAPSQFPLGVGVSDYFRASNERMMVHLGAGVHFERYALVEILHQYSLVTGEVKGGVRYSLQKNADGKTLVVE